MSTLNGGPNVRQLLHYCAQSETLEKWSQRTGIPKLEIKRMIVMRSERKQEEQDDKQRKQESLVVSYLLLKYAIRLWNENAQKKSPADDDDDNNRQRMPSISLGGLLVNCTVSIRADKSVNEDVLKHARLSANFLKRTQQLRRQVEDRTYAKMVGIRGYGGVQDNGSGIDRDLTVQESRNPFLTMRGQMTIGLDIVVTMFTMFVLFYVVSGFMASSLSDSYRHGVQLASGVIGLIVGLIIDMILFVIRAERSETIASRSRVNRSEASGAAISTRRRRHMVQQVATTSGTDKVKRE